MVTFLSSVVSTSVSRSFTLCIIKSHIVFLVFTVFVGCASHKTANKKVSRLDCDKTICFSLDFDSKYAKIEYKGDHWGDSPYPDYRHSLRKAVEELDRVSSAKLIYTDAPGFPNDSIIQVVVEIEKIIWEFKGTKVNMEAELIYKMPNRSINLMANNRVYLAGTKKGNVFKTLKHGNSMLLSILCDESE